MGESDAPVRPVAPGLARYAGLAGAILLTVAGWLGGALPDAPPRATLAALWHAPHGPVTLGCWLVGTMLLVAAWWSLRWGAPSGRWAYLTAGLWSLPLLAAPPLGSRDVYSYVCQGWTWTRGTSPYRVGVEAAGCPWTGSVSPIWRDTPAPYGPFFVLLAGLAVLAGGGLVGAIVLLRLVALAGVLLVALCLPGLARAAGVPTRRAAWLVLACPLVGVHLVAGAHNDALALGLVLLGLLVLIRRPGKARALVVAGVLLGLAVAVKAIAVVVLPFAALAAVLGRYTWRALLRDGGRLAAVVLGTLVLLSLATGLGLGWVDGLGRSGDSRQWTSPPTAVGFVVDYAGELAGRQPHAVPVTRAIGLVLLAGLLVALWWWAWTALRALNDTRQRVARLTLARPRTALLGAGLASAATVLLAPVFHPWYATWPLALLAVAVVPPARTVWFVAPCAVASVLALPDGTNLARFTKAPGAVLMTVLVVVVVVRAVRAGPAPRWRSRPGRC
ncbi:polyprenol phosphomannose-dependent alpha 1,6 mannosyltransferase MptB [Micromonospora sp. WMMD980]|uniref:polyprenol phosphomannose-dependent alpha 1,6 mannosyltransferase MptB n=1 Tax=Micromonospora sp. WMMD980 TaxID=3016088 RepID=UPI002415BEAA|nr:polyprenol phosphomannose-dependent alpha 1,6 mannosyltransferase MptB [Micromonospora sp. WMMD980]MDG4799478.1 polyprenol phosphomannose-dependent alpha 1,6 mannosyltransferase MptB [Micromonospora sp. WMMD980]